MRTVARLACVALLTVSLGPAISTSGQAAVAKPSYCVAATVVGFAVCTSPRTMDPTWRYVIVAPAKDAEWYVNACGRHGCANANWMEDPKAGTLRASGCPCYAGISLSHPGEVVPAIRFFSSVTIGIVTSVP